jgi:hypothetical protein
MLSERLNSRLEWQGAEFLVLARLLIEAIECYKPYVNHPDYDLVAIDAEKRRVARISVKSRWATNRAGWFPLGSHRCDFVVHVALNRGVRKRKQLIGGSIREPDIYVFPISACLEALSSSNKINIRNITQYQTYKNSWAQIRAFLNLQAAATSA